MKGLLGFLGMSVGGALGWWVGEFWGMGVAALLSAVGSGVGLYYTRKLAAHYLE